MIDGLLLSILICTIFCIGYAVDSPNGQEMLKECISGNQKCSDLSNACLLCDDYNQHTDCVYGAWLNVTCHVPNNVQCISDSNGPVYKRARCMYCYQTEPWEQSCIQKPICVAIQTPTHYYRTNCSVNADVMCIGSREFQKKLKCNWTRGHKWSTALLLSITLGGFGADRFYLGHWQEGIGKLFSFGGLGVWTLVDVLLIAIRYLGPADGSFYV